ncbi:MAG: OmpA family protein [Verrucomicrobiota bacterium]|nr:OmpA family protein [Verrucomicrobiota bacterium]
MRLLIRFFAITALALSAACSRNSNQSWEDVKTAGRYVQRGVDALWGKDYESRMLTSDEEFIGPYDGEFIPLNDSDLKNSFAATDMALPQPKGVPGQKGIPGLDQFYNPPDILLSLFRTLHFETDEHILRDKSDLQVVAQIAGYMKKNPKVFLMVAGHCDERAPASYNMALGIKRANYIRGLLVKNGVDLNRIYTVSRGKEEPVAFGHSPDDWKVNRRAEFKLYEK